MAAEAARWEKVELSIIPPTPEGSFSLLGRLLGDRFLGWEDPVEEDTATHSGILDCKIPRTEKPGGLQSMGLQRVGHN